MDLLNLNEVISVPLLETVKDESLLLADNYLQANPDVRAAGVNPIRHFIEYGKTEGRRQFVNAPPIRELRDLKLSRLKFRTKPRSSRASGEPFDYLSDEIKNSFEIPDNVPVAENNYHPEILEIINDNPEKLILDVGAGLRHTYYSNVVNAEIWPAVSTDVVCVGEELPFEDDQFDYIFCLAVLEHTKRPWVACKEILRVLKPGGMVRIDWPFLQPFHGYPHHFFNATSVGAISMFEDQCDIVSAVVKPWQHPIFAVAWLLEEWNRALPAGVQSEFTSMTIGELISRPSAAFLQEPFCTELPAKDQHTISAGTTLTARKR